MKAIDWTQMYKDYPGKWVALAGDQVTVLASGRTLHSALTKAEKKGYKSPIMNYVPKTHDAYIGIL